MQVNKVEDMLKKAIDENKQLQPSSVEVILKYVQSLAPQEKDACYRAISQVVGGGTKALYPKPISSFMGTVSTVHQDKPGRKKLSSSKNVVPPAHPKQCKKKRMEGLERTEKL